jgi:hypothetical protein
MDPITISVAASLLKASGLGGWLADKLGGAIGEKAASKVIGIASAVTGLQNPEEIEAKIRADQQMADALRNKLIDNEQEIIRLQYADLASARDMYKSHNEMADQIANRVMAINLPAIVILLIANCLIVHFVTNPAVSLAIGNIIGASVQALWQERQSIIGFFFGSSVGSKDKSRILEQSK